MALVAAFKGSYKFFGFVLFLQNKDQIIPDNKKACIWLP